MTTLGKRPAGSADAEDLLDHAVRIGLVSYGIVHLLIAWLAVQLMLGDESGQVSGTGALHQLATNSVGRISLYVVAAGLGALVVWQVIEAATGHRRDDEPLRTGKRVVSVGKAVIYGTLGVAALKTALGSGSSGSGGSTDTWTSRLMSQPYGPALVAAVGLVILGVGVGLAYRGWTEKFLRHLDGRGRTGREGTAYVWLGKAGYLSKGAALALVAALFLWAAATHDPEKSGGLDRALQQLLGQPFGVVLLALIAAGIACYGVFCFAWARHLDR